MAKAIWTGILSFGLVSLPCRLYTATQSTKPRAHEVQRGTGARVRHQRVTESGEPVAYTDVVKGFEIGPEQIVAVEPYELQRLAPPKSKSIDIAGFVPLDRIDPLYYAERAYFLGPAEREYARVYSLLREALARNGKVGIAQFTMRDHRYLGAVRALPDLMVLQTLRRAEDVRDPQGVDYLPHGDVNESELAIAEQLLDLLSIDWEPQQYRNDYEHAVRELVDSKAGRKEILSTAGEATDLMAMLERSIAAAKAEQTPPTRRRPKTKR